MTLFVTNVINTVYVVYTYIVYVINITLHIMCYYFISTAIFNFYYFQDILSNLPSTYKIFVKNAALFYYLHISSLPFVTMTFKVGILLFHS